MHTKNKGKTKKNNRTQAYSTPRAEARAGPGWGPQAQTGGAVGSRFIVFPTLSFVFGMNMPFWGWKLILDWIEHNTRN